jgi:hypothetical protein
MKNKHLLKTEQLLCINDSIVEWEPAKEGETRFGDPLFGVASDFSHRGMIIRNEERITSVRMPTEEETKEFYSARKSHNAYMSDYYDKNSYTGD